MADNNPYRQLDPASHSDARMWREYDASRPAGQTIREELTDRKRALASIDEVHGEWEGDDYWALGADPNETAAQAAERRRREEQQRGNGLGYGVQDDSDADSEDSHYGEEDFEECESDAEHPDGERPVTMPPSQLRPGDILGEASATAWSTYGNSRIVDFVVAFEDLQSEIHTFDDYEALRGEAERIISGAYALAARFHLPRSPLTEIFEAAGTRMAERQEDVDRERNHEQLMEDLDIITDQILEDECELRVIEDMIAYQRRLFEAGMLIWRRDAAPGAAKFLRFVEAARTSLKTQYEGPTDVFQHSIYCWAIGVFDIPEYQVEIIRKLARLQYERALLLSDIHDFKRSEHLYLTAEDDEPVPWESAAAYVAFKAFDESADGEACTLHERCHGRYGYEHQTIIGGKVKDPYGYAEFISPADVPFLTRLEIMRAGFDIRVVRHGQALRNPQSIRHLAVNRNLDIAIDSHKSVALGVFKWIKDAVIHLAQDPYKRSLSDRESRRQLCEDMINFSATLNKESHVRELMLFAIENGLVPFSAFQGYHGGGVNLPANARPKMIRDTEWLARRERKRIIVLEAPPPELQRRVVQSAETRVAEAPVTETTLPVRGGNGGANQNEESG
ncbi:hypothetical protein BST61_g10266 [Cercospora zeina]